ncbi:MAG: hypothetical protein ACLFQK_11095 [Fibrobacterota bacterium]
MAVGTSGGYEESIEMGASRAAVKDLVKQIRSGLSEVQWKTDRIKIDGNRVYTNAGTDSGLKKYMRFAIYKKGARSAGQKRRTPRI